MIACDDCADMMAAAVTDSEMQLRISLLVSCTALLLMVWRSGLIQGTVWPQHSTPGVCSAPAGALVNASTVQQPPRMIMYAHNCCRISKKRACKSAMKHAFGSCADFDLADLNQELLSPEGLEILNENGSWGAGHWVWKPLLILQELLRAEEGDIIVYMDSDSEIMSDVAPVLHLLDKQDVVGFSSGQTEAYGTKTDVLLLFNATHLKDTRQLYAGLILLRRSWRSIGFVQQWLTYCQDRRWVTNMPNSLLPYMLRGQQHPGFFAHYSDQALFSLLYKKWGFKVWPDPTANPNDAWAHNHPFPGFWVFHHNRVSEKNL